MPGSERRYAVFILSHGRPDQVYTVKMLRKGGYSGAWYIVCDDEDEILDEYKKRFRSKVIVFSKARAASLFDMMDNLPERNVVVFARNYVFRIAKEMGLTHFIVFDDDYVSINYKVLRKGRVVDKRIRNLDRLFDYTLDLLDETGALVIAYAQAGDFLGGKDNDFLSRGFKRKAMNTFFFKTDRPMEFMGRLNEDVNAYVFYGMRGELIFSVASVMLYQKRTQMNPGGLTDAYRQLGTYVKSFYTVMLAPSCVKVSGMGDIYLRLHHRIEWDYCVPQILADGYRKVSVDGGNLGKTTG